MAKFNSIPNVPPGAIPVWHSTIINTTRDNVNLLTGADASGREYKAILKGEVTVKPLDTQQMTRVTAKGTGYTISKVKVSAVEDVVSLMTDVQVLANDLAQTRRVLNILIEQLRK